MKAKPIVIFAAVIALSTAATVTFIQSATFARYVKGFSRRYLPSNLGLDLDFSNLSVKFFPPAIAIVNPRVAANAANPAGLPIGTQVRAEELQLSFRPVQMFSGKVSIREVRVVNGYVKTSIPKPEDQPKKKSKLNLNWKDLFEIRTETVALENTRVELEIPDLKMSAKFNAKELEIEQKVDEKESYYDGYLHLDAVEADFPKAWKIPRQIDSFRVSASLRENELSLNQLEIIREGTEIRADGAIAGPILKGRDLRADLSLKIQGDIQRMFQFLQPADADGKAKPLDLPSGHVAFEGKAKADLDRLEETVDANGTVDFEHIRYGDMGADKIHVDGQYNARTKELRVRQALLEGKEIPKKGPQPGSGGKIEIGAFRYKLDGADAVEADVKLTRAHVLWLASPLLKDFYSLDGRITGDVEARFVPPAPNRKWAVGAKVKWLVDTLQLDNQRYGKTKPLSRLIAVPGVSVAGTVSVTPSLVKLENFDVGVKTTKLKVAGEIRLKQKTEYEILGSGPVDLAELGILAENPIRGTGPLSVHVYGPSDRVMMDFDGQIRDFYYLHMNFGEFAGRVSWEDAPSVLHLRNLACRKGATAYAVDGRLELGERDQMEIQLKVPGGGNIGDFNAIFSELTKDFWWYPSTLTGAMTGGMRVYGGVSLDRMMIDANIQGQNWEFLGERARAVSLKGGYDKGKYYLSSFGITKRTGEVSGRLSYDAKGTFDWKIDSKNLSLLDWDRVASLDVPMRGNVKGWSEGGGPTGAVRSRTEVTLVDTVVRGKRLADSKLRIESRDGKAIVHGSGMNGQAEMDATYDFTDGNPSSIRLSADGLDFSPLAMLINPSLQYDERLTGTVTGKYELNFQTGKAELGSGYGKISEYRLQKTGTQIRLDRPVEFRIDHGTFEIADLGFSADSGRLAIDLRSRNGNLDGRVRGNAELGIAEFLTPAIAEAEGGLDTDIRIGGTLKLPEFQGTGKVRQALVRVPSVETPFENIAMDLSFEKNVVTIDRMEADLAGGRVTGDGAIELFFDRYPKLALEANLNGNRIKVFPFQVAKVRGKLDVAGDRRPYLVSGKVFIDSAISREKISGMGGLGLKSAQYAPPAGSRSDLPLFALDIAVAAPGNILVQNELMDLEAKGDLRIVGTLEDPRPLGKGQAISGNILFKDRAFQIQSGTMEFDNPSVVNPRFEVIGTTEVGNRKISLYVAGHTNDFKIEFTSNPPMSENDILTLLALGVSADDRKYRTADRSAYEQGEAASLVLHSLDFNREVQNKTGFQIGVDEAVDTQSGNSAFRRSSEADANASAPKIVIRRQIGKRLGLSVGSTVGVGTNIQREVNAEVKVTNGLSVLGVWDTFEGVNQDETRRSSYGIDMKVQKRFK